MQAMFAILTLALAGLTILVSFVPIFREPWNFRVQITLATLTLASSLCTLYPVF